jgi:DNA-binding CsgD family transcriptional regulator
VNRVIRRHRTNGLGPALLDALSHHWLFPETAATLRELGPSQVVTWLGHLSAKAPADNAALERGRQGRPARTQGTKPARPTQLEQLSRREREVLDLMARDRSNDQIAAELFIALSTVKTHVNHILRKLGQTTRIGAVLEQQRLGGSIGDPAVHPETSSSPPRGVTPNPPWV